MKKRGIEPPHATWRSQDDGPSRLVGKLRGRITPRKVSFHLGSLLRHPTPRLALEKLWFARFPYECPLFELHPAAAVEAPIMVDLGAASGGWSRRARGRYAKARLLLVEPIHEFAQALRRSHEADGGQTVILEFGVTAQGGEREIWLAGDGKSMHRQSEGLLHRVETISVEQLFQRIDEAWPGERVSLLQMNIEGEEYGCIDALHSAGLSQHCDVICIQFHWLDWRSVHLRRRARKLLSHTHRCTVSVPFIWERWEANAPGHL